MATTCNDPAGWLGRTLRGSDGSPLGTISQVYSDDETGVAEWLAVRTGAPGSRVSLVPARGINPRGVKDVVSVWDKGSVQEAPDAGPGQSLSARERTRLRRHYGMPDVGIDDLTDDAVATGTVDAATGAKPRARRGAGTNLTDLEGLEAEDAAVLVDAGVRTIDALLAAAGSAAGRRSLAKQTGIDAATILEWVNRADLMRIKGVGSEFSDLLEASGVDSVKELATRKPANLQAKMAEVNQLENLVRRAPSVARVERWVAEAKDLPIAVTH